MPESTRRKLTPAEHEAARLRLTPEERRRRSRVGLQLALQRVPPEAALSRATLEAKIFAVELGPTAPAAVAAWNRVSAIEREIAAIN